MSFSGIRLSLAITVVAALAAPAAAQNSAQSRFDVTGGYQWLQSDEQSFPLGANVDLARTWGPLSLVGEIGWAYDQDETLSQVIDFHWHSWNAGAGPRWDVTTGGRLRPFVQLLGGVLHTRFTAAFPERDPALPSFGPPSADRGDRTSTNTAFTLQPGIGLNVLVADSWGFLGQLDYRRSFIDDADVPEPTVDGPTNGENQLRFVVGVRRSF